MFGDEGRSQKWMNRILICGISSKNGIKSGVLIIRNSLFMTSFDPYNEKYHFISNEPHSSKLKSSFRSQFEICQLDQQWKNYLKLRLQSIAPNALKPLRAKMNTKNTDQIFIKREKIIVNFVTKAIL